MTSAARVWLVLGVFASAAGCYGSHGRLDGGSEPDTFAHPDTPAGGTADGPDVGTPDALDCDRDRDGDRAIVCGGPDCDDGRADRFPGATERCDASDDDCDGAVDEGTTVVVFTDADGDGHGDPATARDACGLEPGLVTLGDDCDDTSASRYPGAAVTAPRGLLPVNGATTGSLHATEAETLRPLFRWTASDACDARYELVVDDTCTAPNGAGCTFPSPEVSGLADLTERRPIDDLPVDRAQPVGRRYFWRVRACAADVCSEWTRTRYVDVGRLASDFDGDGYADLVAGTRYASVPVAHEGRVSVYPGSPTGPAASPSIVFDDPDDESFAAFGEALAAAGDLDADGFGDLVVGAPGKTDGRGLAYVFHGGAAGLRASPDARLSQPGGRPRVYFGASVEGAGDVDGDGFADVVVGSTRDGVHVGLDGDRVEGVAALFRGGAAGVSTEPSAVLTAAERLAEFGETVAGGDVDDDGFSDVVVSAEGVSALYRYPGSELGLGAPIVERVTLSDYPGTLRVADVTGDGAAEVMATAYGAQAPILDVVGGTTHWVGFPREPSGWGYLLGPELGRIGETAVLAADAAGSGRCVWLVPLDERWSTIDHVELCATSAPELDGSFFEWEARLALLDLDGDGLDDVVAGFVAWTDGGTGVAAIWWGRHATSGRLEADVVLAPPTNDGRFAAAFAR